jgi:D-serine deaminase-like pyridoxal phosphate-dependent protein
MHLQDIDTPAVVVDLDRLEANIARFQSYLDTHHIANRPHIKTHKIPAIAHMQVKAGAIGITCQKVGEAEIMAAAGIQDIFIPYNIIGAQKLERLMQLARQIRMSVSADSEYTVRGLSEAARAAGVTLIVLVECDTGMGRCGVQTPQAAADLARLIARSAGLHYGGLMIYPNSEAADKFIVETRKLLTADGLAIERITSGGTPGMWRAHLHPDVTEYRSGMYIYGDRGTVRNGAIALDECSFHVLATVVSRPTADRGILDSGSKALSSDLLGLDGYGMILEYPDAQIYGLSEEHSHVDFSACPKKPEIGERVTVLPNHCCVVTNLFNEVIGVRKANVEVVWPVACRGSVK